MAYQWYSQVGTDSVLAQGDFIFGVHMPVAIDYSAAELIRPPEESSVEWRNGDWIILTQSCDLDPKNGRMLEYITVCPVFRFTDFIAKNSSYQGSAEKKKTKRAGVINNKEVGLHILKCPHYKRFGNEPFIVNFYDALTVKNVAIKEFLESRPTKKRLRLNPPYVEALALRFSTLFSRIGYEDNFPTKTEATAINALVS